MTQRVVVIGGGVGGLAAARLAARDGARVTVIEGAPTLGGLVADFQVAGTPLERFYHYLVPGEPDILELIEELGLTDAVEWFPSSIGVLTGGKVWPFTTPVDLLRFAPLRPADRIQAGVGALRLGRIRDWRALDRVRAVDWLASLTSPAVTEVVWRPLLSAKFGPAAGDVPAAWMWGRLQQRRGARRGTGELLGYLRGGFGRLFEALEHDLCDRGVEIRTGTPVLRIVVEAGRVTGVALADGVVVPADVVLFTGALPRLPALLPADLVDPRWTAARGLGCQCVILELSHPLTEVFWTNVCDQNVPFGGIIEHTNLIPPEWYGGHHLVYLSRYFTSEEPIAASDPETEADSWLEAAERLFPHFRRDAVLSVNILRTPYAAPLVSTPYLPQVVPVESGVPGLFLSTTAQVYPQDRGMSEAIRRAGIAMDVVTNGSWRCPVCGGTDADERFAVTTDATEGGVNPVAFRPSPDEYGRVAERVLYCASCGHGSLRQTPDAKVVNDAYTEVADPVSLREERGQMVTADRALQLIEEVVPGGQLLDVACWTGSFLAAANARGWEAVGIEPSRWALDRARERGLDAREGVLRSVVLPSRSFQAVVACDVLEHLGDPALALDEIATLLAPGGVLYLTVPDAGSRLARWMGARWRSVLPMHFQYFTRASMTRLLQSRGFEVLSVATHPKAFSARYYGERAASFVPAVGNAALRIIDRTSLADRLVAPDFRDRMAVLAKRP